MVDVFVEISMFLGAFFDILGMVGGLFVMAALFWLMLTEDGRHVLDWFGEKFL